MGQQELLAHLQELAAELGRSPTTEEMHEHGQYTAQAYYYYFDTWDEALEAASIDPEEPSPVSEEEIVAEISRLATDESPPTTDQMDAEGAYSARTCADRFGTWNEAVRAAGYEPLKRSDEYTEEELLEEIDRVAEDLFSREELVDELQRLAEEVDRPPTTQQMNEQGRYSVSPYQNVFGSWIDALRAAGFEPTTHQLRPSGF